MADAIGLVLGLLELGLATGVVALLLIALTGHASPVRDLAEGLVVPAAALSFGAAAIHLWVVPEHAAEYQPYGIAFLVAAVIQGWWAATYLRRRPDWLLRGGIVLNAGVVAVYAWSRIVGLPWGPVPGVPEQVGGADVVATLFELALIAILVVQLRPGRRIAERPVTARRAGDLRAVVIAAVCVFSFLAATAPPHGHGETGASPEPSAAGNVPP